MQNGTAGMQLKWPYFHYIPLDYILLFYIPLPYILLPLHSITFISHYLYIPLPLYFITFISHCLYIPLPLYPITFISITFISHYLRSHYHYIPLPLNPISVYIPFISHYLYFLFISHCLYIPFISHYVESYLTFLLFLIKLCFSDTTVIEGGRERKYSWDLSLLLGGIYVTSCP